MRCTGSTGVMARLFAYSAVGVLNTFTDFLVFVLLTSGFGYHSVPANVVSYSAGAMLSFIMNRKFTFRSSFYTLDLKRQFIRFCAVNLLSLGMSTALVYLLSQSMAPALAKILSVPFVLMWGFLAVRTFVFASPAPEDRN
jgi:putative flippase GtrA